MNPTPGGGVTGIFENRVQALTPVAEARRVEFATLPPERAEHARAHLAVPALRQIEQGGPAVPAPAASGPLRIAAWNLERCLYPERAAALLRAHGVRLALLTEMDCGMLRTGQVHTTAEVAAALGHRYAYAVEFLELADMPPPPGFPALGDGNSLGFHGNALIGSVPLDNAAVIRLDEVGDWFVAPWKGQRRIGNRMAVSAEVDAGAFRFLACSVHLENRTDGMGRAAQMHSLFDALDGLADGLPILVGGDLNARVAPGAHDDPAEPLFTLAKRRGYEVAACNAVGRTTRNSVWNTRDAFPQLDWFFVRGLTAADPAIVPSLDPDGTVLSDHDAVLLSISV